MKPVSDSSAVQAGHAFNSRSNTDEIDLHDLWDALVRQRRWVLGSWLLVLAMVGLWLALTEPVYESRAVIRVSSVAGEAVISPATLALMLREEYQLEDPRRELPRLKSVAEEGSEALVLVSEAYSAEQARQLLESVVKSAQQRQRQSYRQLTALKQKALGTVQQQIQQREQHAAKLEQALADADLDEAATALLLLEISALKADLPALHARVAALESELAARNTHPAEALREPVLADRPSSPRTGLMLGLAFILGGMVGVMAGLVAEFLRNIRSA